MNLSKLKTKNDFKENVFTKLIEYYHFVFFLTIFTISAGVLN
jgi:hypothetical protein